MTIAATLEPIAPPIMCRHCWTEIVPLPVGSGYLHALSTNAACEPPFATMTATPAPRAFTAAELVARHERCECDHGAGFGRPIPGRLAS